MRVLVGHGVVTDGHNASDLAAALAHAYADNNLEIIRVLNRVRVHNLNAHIEGGDATGCSVVCAILARWDREQRVIHDAL